MEANRHTLEANVSNNEPQTFNRRWTQIYADKKVMMLLRSIQIRINSSAFAVLLARFHSTICVHLCPSAVVLYVWDGGSRRACFGLLDVRFVCAMRYPTLLALISILLPAVCFGETAAGQHPEEFRGTVTRLVQMKYLLFIPDGYRDDHGILDTYENEELYSWLLEHARTTNTGQ
jgi:hypothetical protein